MSVVAKCDLKASNEDDFDEEYVSGMFSSVLCIVDIIVSKICIGSMLLLF
jgi:hypothetical protein